MEAVKQDGEALGYASDELRANKDVVLAAVQQHGGALWYASNELKNDPDIKAAAKQANQAKQDQFWVF